MESQLSSILDSKCQFSALHSPIKKEPETFGSSYKAVLSLLWCHGCIAFVSTHTFWVCKSSLVNSSIFSSLGFALLDSAWDFTLSEIIFEIRIGPDRAYPLHFTRPQLLLLLLLPVLLLPLLCVCEQKWWEDGIESVSFCFWALSFEIIKFHAFN